MRLEMLACVFFIIVSIVAVRVWQERADLHTQSAQTQVDQASVTAAEKKQARRDYYAREVRIPAASNAHFYVDARVNRRGLNFLVDTGATFVALRESDARRAGILLSQKDFTVSISTANGKAYAAKVQLDSIDIGGLEITGVDAFVMPDDKLNVNLLGMSYLSKLSSFQTRDGELVLKG